MFTNPTTKRCGCFVWGRSFPAQPNASAPEQSSGNPLPWTFGTGTDELVEPAVDVTVVRPRNAGEPWVPSSRQFRKTRAFTLIEVMIASSLALLALLAIGLLSWYSSRSFAAIANYVELDQKSHLALDKLSREVRQARRLINFSPTELTLLDINNEPLQFIYQSDSRTLLRVSGGESNLLLSGCDFLEFSKYQHTPISNTFDAYEPAYLTNSKLIQVSWSCSRKILGAKVNTESVQSSKIALRNN